MKEELLRFLELLTRCVGCKSVSTDPAFADGIQAAVTLYKTEFEKRGFVVTLLQGPNTNPVIVASYHQSDAMETYSVYGHYDVQPAKADDEWIGDPFVARIDNGRIYARGVMDNKAQHLVHVFTAFELIEKGELGCNIKFIIEGNEETNNPDLADLVAANVQLLKCDVLIVSDGEIEGTIPCIELSLRGGGNFALTFKTAHKNVHSGTYGGAIPNAAMEMNEFLAKMIPADGPVGIPGFYDDVDPISQDRLAYHLDLLTHINPIEKIGAKTTIGNHDFYTMTGLWPTMQVTGQMSGYVEEGYSNIVPSLATAKINVRLVDSQSPERIKMLIKDYTKANVPQHVEWELSMTNFAPAFKADIASPQVRQIMQWQAEIYGHEPMIKNVGGGIPIVADFKALLGVNPILLPLGGTDSSMHGPNENMRIELIEKGLELSYRIFKKKR